MAGRSDERRINMKIQVGDFVFCNGEGMAIFPITSIDVKNGTAYLDPSVRPKNSFTDMATGGNEYIHSLTLVRNTEWAVKFPEFC